jgi:hypothetical protein
VPQCITAAEAAGFGRIIMGVLDWDQPARRQGPQDTHHPHDTIERLCLDSGWVFISREVDYYRVRSGGHQSNVYVDIRSSERFSNMLFQCWFPIRFSLEKPPSGLFGRVLLRSHDLHWSAWRLCIGGSCEACLYLCTVLPAGSVNAALFRDVCEEMAGETRAFLHELRDKFNYGPGTAVGDPPPKGRSGVSAPPIQTDFGYRYLT